MTKAQKAETIKLGYVMGTLPTLLPALPLFGGHLALASIMAVVGFVGTIAVIFAGITHESKKEYRSEYGLMITLATMTSMISLPVTWLIWYMIALVFVRPEIISSASIGPAIYAVCAFLAAGTTWGIEKIHEKFVATPKRRASREDRD